MDNALVVAPHSDDECLGPGGTIALLAQAGVDVTVVTVGSEFPPLFASGLREQVHTEAKEAHAILGVKESIFLDIPTVEIDRAPTAEINRAMQDVVDGLRPKLVLIPFPDRHVDHRAAFETAMVATRPYRLGTHVQAVAMYETISETFWNAPGAEPTFTPHWTIDITETIETKVRAFEAFRSRQVDFPGPRTGDALRALAMFRGSQASCAYGESFQFVRASFSPLDFFGGDG